MQVCKALSAGRPRRLPGRFLIVALALCAMGATCESNPQPGAVPPTITLSVNGVPDDMKGLLVLPPTGFVVNVAWQPGTYPVNPTLFAMFANRWGSVSGSQYVFDIPLKSDGTGAVGVFTGQLEPGTHTLRATVGDTQKNFFYVELAVAVRNFSGAPPIGAGQQIWLDFESDRDATPGADFPVDLQAFGLGSAAAPLVSSQVLDDVTGRVLDRIGEAYLDHPTNGLPGADPVAVVFSSTNPGSGDVTRVCIGGEDPGGGITVGAIITDPKNSNRNSVECATLPPTGIFPRELLILAGEAYLRDRVVTDSSVTVLAFPPVVSSITPSTIVGGAYTQIFVNGSGFLPTPVIRRLGASYTYNVTGESLLSSSQVKGWVNYSQIPPGVFDVELRNPDGQISVLPAALTISPP